MRSKFTHVPYRKNGWNFTFGVKKVVEVIDVEMANLVGNAFCISCSLWLKPNESKFN